MNLLRGQEMRDSFYRDAFSWHYEENPYLKRIKRVMIHREDIGPDFQIHLQCFCPSSRFSRFKSNSFIADNVSSISRMDLDWSGESILHSRCDGCGQRFVVRIGGIPGYYASS